MISLDGRTMYVSQTANCGVVGSDTRLHFSQRGNRVFARYSGGSVARGWLVGEYVGEQLTFRYAQREGAHEIHGGSSTCDVELLTNGCVRITEHFSWSTREGTGVNVFDELVKAQTTERS